MPVNRSKRRLPLAGLLAAMVTVAACTSAPSGTPRTGAAARATGSQSAPAVTRVTAPRITAPPAPPVPPAVPRVTVTRMRTADGSTVTVAALSGPVRYVLHNGSGDPGAAARVVRAGPAVTGAERKQLLAAFNGGFKLAAGAGGYEQEGHVISPLHAGFASLIIGRSGQASIGVWGQGTTATGLYSVRQNLKPLVLAGKPTAAAYDWSVWGVTLGGGAYVARSALGQDAAGNLIYAASMSAVPIDLAKALVAHGARIAMQLDINPSWVQLDVASRPGGSLHAEVTGQYRPADQYLYGWTRDFVTVLATPGASAVTRPDLARIQRR